MQVPKIGFVSLGCPKALVDSEQILTQLRAEGYETVPTYADADLVVVNTCGFIDDAIHESLDAIGEAIAVNGKVLVTGCLGARPEDIRQVHPKVLGITGPHATDEVMRFIHEHLPRPHDPFLDLLPPAGIKLTPRHYAYLKISEGCDHRCSFCIIPSMRGDLDSRTPSDILAEATRLLNAGVRELLVISQDTSAYGLDKREPGQKNLPFIELSKQLHELTRHYGAWCRLHYVYPYPHVDEIVPLMSMEGLVPYLDIPFQHASPRVLRAMKRPAHAENTLARIKKWRSIQPDLVIRSTFIVGFPGETDDDFEQLLAWMTEAQIDRCGAFIYSPVVGAAANNLANPVPEAVAKQRHEQFMQHAAHISAERLEQRVGQQLSILIDSLAKAGRRQVALGHSIFEAPEVDGHIELQGRGVAKLQPGQRVMAEIIGSDQYDLIAKLL
jgi:ribosomal protein S12 methylthiotransferase